MRCILWAKAQMEKRDTSLIWHSQCWKHGSGAVGRRLSTVSWQEEQRKYCVTALIRKSASFIHGYIGYLAHFWFAAATSSTIFSKLSSKNIPVEEKRTLSCVPLVLMPSSDSTVMQAHFWEMEPCLFLFQGAALIYHKIWIIWHQHLFEEQDQI